MSLNYELEIPVKVYDSKIQAPLSSSTSWPMDHICLTLSVTCFIYLTAVVFFLNRNRYFV